MPLFRVEQYECHVTEYEVEAASAAEAIRVTLTGEGEFLSTEYIEADERRGMLRREHPELAAELLRLGICGITDVIPAIRSVRQVDGEEDEGEEDEEVEAATDSDQKAV